MSEAKLSARELVAWLRTAHGNATRIHDTADALEAALNRVAELEAAPFVGDGRDRDLDEIEARAGKATIGPWGYERWPKPDGPICIFEMMEDDPPIMSCGGGIDEEQATANAEFVTWARSDVPLLVAMLRVARARQRELEAALLAVAIDARRLGDDAARAAVGMRPLREGEGTKE